MGGHCRGSPLYHLEEYEAVAIQKETRDIYTIGHSTLPSDDFVGLLQCHAIQTVADVRRFPTSRKNPHYARDALLSALNTVVIAYVWLGNDLGGFRSGGYEAYMETEGFHQGLMRLEELAGISTTAIMCAEKLYTGCHRRFIADALAQRGWQVIHIIASDQVYEHSLQQDLF